MRSRRPLAPLRAATFRAAALLVAATAATAASTGCNLLSGLADLHVGDTTTGTGGSTTTGTSTAGTGGTGGTTTTTGGTGGTASTGGSTAGTGGTGGSPSPCGDGEKNGAETDTDCGGPDCSPCDAGATCAAPTDCKSEHCSGTCIAAARITAGNAHACAVTTKGDIFCWGANTRGQLGLGTTSPSSPPGVVSLHEAADLAAGGIPEDKDAAHTCALTLAGDVFCWGANTRGQLGDSSTVDADAPLLLPAFTGATAITAGGELTCALDALGAPFCWGGDTFGEVGGDGDGADSSEPLPVKDSGLDLTGATAIAAGVRHACAALPGDLVCWGHNVRGELGGPPLLTASKLLHVAGLGAVSRLAAGYDTTCAQDAAGLWCWGDNRDGQLTDGAAGDLSTAPIQVAVPSPLGISLGADGDAAPNNPAGAHACAITAASKVTCWGNNRKGQLGRGTTSEKEPVPAEVPGLTGVTQLATGAEFTCALLATGAIRCWGRNDRGQLGTAPSPGAQSSPVPISWP